MAAEACGPPSRILARSKQVSFSLVSSPPSVDPGGSSLLTSAPGLAQRVQWSAPQGTRFLRPSPSCCRRKISRALVITLHRGFAPRMKHRDHASPSLVWPMSARNNLRLTYATTLPAHFAATVARVYGAPVRQQEFQWHAMAWVGFRTMMAPDSRIRNQVASGAARGRSDI